MGGSGGESVGVVDKVGGSVILVLALWQGRGKMCRSRHSLFLSLPGIMTGL